MASFPSQTSSTSPPPSTNPKKYDVFLSFRGEETRNSFTDYLYTALHERGITTFKDDVGLEKGECISELFKAIEESRIAVVILSSKYANSRWCLDEVAKIVDCGLLILPVFYHVKPADVKHHTGTYKEHFEEHEEKFEDGIEKVKKWKEALNKVGNLSGYTLEGRIEREVIKEIVQRVYSYLNLQSNTAFSTADLKEFVGMHRVEVIEADLLIDQWDEVRVIGICGMPGIGKTTIARVIFEKIRTKFEASSFVDNVGDVYEKKSLLHIQKQLYKELLHSEVDSGNVNEVRGRLHNRRVLLILDSVDDLIQIKHLAGKGGEELKDWFGKGSRILITTRDEKLLTDYGVDNIHKIETLTEDEALLLFRLNAFKKDTPQDDKVGLCYKFIDYADGLPLALEVFGSFLSNRSVKEWELEYAQLKANNYCGEEKLFGILKASINGLRSGDKQNFLDTACFFRGYDVNRVEKIFERSGNVNILLERSLVTIVGGKLWMHDLLQETGRRMVREESEELGKRSRLWLHREAQTVLESNKGTSAIRGIFLSPPEQKNVNSNGADPFFEMSNLRLLKIKNVTFSANPDKFVLSNELNILEWHGFPLKSLPSSLKLDNLVELNLSQSSIEHLWVEQKTITLNMLVTMDLSDCKDLTKTPDFKAVRKLEKLILKGCKRLSEVDSSILGLQWLHLLNLEGCESLVNLPRRINLRSLITLILSGCSKFQKFPEIGKGMEKLSELRLRGTAIDALPASIKNLTGLSLLDLADCKELSSLPNDICTLMSLRCMTLAGCSNLHELPENFGSLEGLELFSIRYSGITRAPSSIQCLKNLKQLEIYGCGSGSSSNSIGFQLPNSLLGLCSLEILDMRKCNLSEGAIPDDIGRLSSLKQLYLSRNNFVTVPSSISELPQLETLLLDNCSNLKSLPELPPNIRTVFARNCPILQGPYANKCTVLPSAVSGFISINCQSSGEIPKLQRVPISEQNRKPLHDQQSYEDKIRRGGGFGYVSCPHTEIPSWFRRQSKGESIRIQLPPDLDGEKQWIGFALCFLTFLYESEVHEQINPDELTYSCNYRCYIYTNEDDVHEIPLQCRLMDNNKGGPNRHWHYAPRHVFANRLMRRSIRVEIRTDRAAVKVTACGARLLYNDDVQEFVHNMIAWESDLKTPPDVLVLRRLTVPSDEPEEEFGCAAETRFLIEIEPRGSGNHSSSSQNVSEVSEPLIRKKLESLLEQLFESGGNARRLDCGFVFCLRAILPWFNNQSIGSIVDPETTVSASEVAVTIPENLYNDKEWVGFALCVSFTLPPDALLPKNSVFKSSLSTADGVGYRLGLVSAGEDSFMGSHRLLVIHIPRVRFTEQLNQLRAIYASFGSNCFGVEVEMCGMRVVYERDLIGLIQTISHCTAISSPPGYYGLAREEQFMTQKGQPFRLSIMDKSLLEAAESSSREPLTFQEPLRDSSSVNSENVVLHILAETPFYQPDMEDSDMEDSVIDWKRNLDLLLQHFFELSDLSVSLNLGGRQISWMKGCNWGIFPQKDIPEWFTEQQLFESLEFPLPRNFVRDQNFVGFVVCAAFSVQGSEAKVLEYLNSKHDPELTCTFRMNPHDEPVDISGKMSGVLPENKFIWLCRRGFIWLQLISRHRVFMSSLNELSEVEVSFRSDSSALTVDSCGIRILYEQDVEEFKQTVVRNCITSFFDSGDLIRSGIDYCHNKRPDHDKQPNQAEIPTRSRWRLCNKLGLCFLIMAFILYLLLS